MANVKAFDDRNLSVIRNRIEAELKKIGAEFGIQMNIGSISYTASTFTTKITAITDQAGISNVDPRWQKAFLRNALKYGMKSTDLGKKFSYNGDQVTLVGARPNARAKLVIQKSDGKFVAVNKHNLV